MILGYDLRDYQTYGIKVPIQIFLPKRTSNILIVGKSGSGKSLSGRWYVYNTLKSGESLVYIADYKAGEEYEAFEGSPSYASGNDAIDLIFAFYDFFEQVRERRIRLHQHYTLYIEEWLGLLTYAETQSKKLKTELQMKVGSLLAVARGLNMGVIICVQRADASLFSNGAREQFQCICSFGRLSTEQSRMLGFSSELEDNDNTNYKPGQGITLVDGQDGIQEIIVPYISNPEVFCSQIRYYLDLQPGLESLNSTIAEGNWDGL